MNGYKSMCLAVLGAGALAACGKSATSNAIQDNAPTYSNMALDMEQSDDSQSSSSSAALGNGDSCHPYLFLRTRNVVRRLNWHLFKTLFVMDAVIQSHPDATAGSTATWTKKGLRYTTQVVGKKVSDTEFTYDVEIKANGADDSAYKTVTTADLTVTSDTAQTGTLHFDFSAYSSVVTQDHSAGTLDYKFTLAGDKKDIEVTLADFQPDDTFVDGNGQPEISPRNAHYVFERAKDVGGSLKYTDELILACPHTSSGAANTTARSSVDTVFRWTKKSDGTWVARGDTQATADAADTNPPNIPSGDKVEGMVCGTLGTGEAEKYWMMKLEDSTGATLKSGTFQLDASIDGVTAAAGCDASFGTTVDTESNASDYDFAAVNFSDSTVADYPGKS